MTRLAETTYSPTPPEVDADRGLLRGVKLLGERSKNNRLYSREVRDAAAPLYEGSKIYLDHARQGGERSYRDWAGVITESESRADGIYGTVKLRKQSDVFAGIVEAAQEFPDAIGFSHVADGATHFDDSGVEIVESIERVFSVDLVTDPATTRGFFESETKAMTKTVREILESVPKNTKRRGLLREMVDAGEMPSDMPVEVEETADPAEEVAAALEKAAVAVLRKLFAGDIEADAAIAEIKKILGMKEEATGDSEPEDAPPVEESEQFQAIAKRLLLVESELKESRAKAALLESGVEPTAPRVKAVASADDAAALIESWAPDAGDSLPNQSPPKHRSEPMGEDAIRELFKSVSRS